MVFRSKKCRLGRVINKTCKKRYVCKTHRRSKSRRMKLLSKKRLMKGGWGGFSFATDEDNKYKSDGKHTLIGGWGQQIN